MIETAVADVMTRSPRTIEETATVEMAARVLTNHDIGSLIVVDGDTGVNDSGSDDASEASEAIDTDGIAVGSVRGIVTEFDVVELVAEGMAPDTHVSSVMSTPVVTITTTETVEAAAGCMKRESVKKLPVVEDATLVGIVTTTDLAHYIPRYRLDIGRRR